jgi:hypothetical protein
MMEKVMDSAALRARSRLLRTLVDVVLATLLLLLAIELVAMLRGRSSGPELLLHRLPMLLYLWAIWNARQAIAAVGRGDMFGPIIARLLGRVGFALFLGGLAQVFFVPWLLWGLGRGPSIAYYDVAAITVGVVGATLMVVAQLLRQAARMRQELDEFF